MTEERIRDIIVENDVHLTDVIIKVMKQAVNEALEEAADEVDFTNDTYTSMQEGSMYEIDKQSILNLKVK